jgi:hypothetical protein
MPGELIFPDRENQIPDWAAWFSGKGFLLHKEKTQEK